MVVAKLGILVEDDKTEVVVEADPDTKGKDMIPAFSWEVAAVWEEPLDITGDNELLMSKVDAGEQ